jgi:thioredoxin-related protein
MKKLTFFSLLLFVTMNCLFADEYISDEYFAEVVSQTEVMSQSIEALPIAKTIEEEAREEKQKMLEEKEEETSQKEILPPFVPELTIQPLEKEKDTMVVEEKQSIQTNTYLDALEQARNEKKIIMITIRSTDCKYCDEMEGSTLSDSSVKNDLEANFITIHYDQDLEPLPLGLQEGMTPNFIFVNTNEDILNMYPGMRSPAEFKEVLEQILDM